MFYVLAFILGGVFGIVLMSLMVVSGRISREEEKRDSQL